MTTLPAWVHWLQALAVPAIAFAGVIVAASNYVLAKRKRQDELFDRRYAFYKKATNAWETAARTEMKTGEAIPDWDAKIYLAGEALFLFGDKMHRHIMDYNEAFDVRDPYAPNSSFTKPFEKYLRLERQGWFR